MGRVKNWGAQSIPAILPMELPNEGPHASHQAFCSADSTESLPHKLLSIVAKRRWLWAAAAILVAAGVALGWRHIQQANQAQLALAEIVESDLVQWSDNSTALLDPVHIAAGKLEMTSGRMTLRFRSGATMWVSGPASLQIVSDMLVKLTDGQATAHVPEWAHGFSIETPNVNVVDLGTKFGVLARKGEPTDVVVFEGKLTCSRPRDRQRRKSV